MPGERTEKPTARRIGDARKKGQIAISRDLIMSVDLLFGLLLLGWFGGQLLHAIKDLMINIIKSLPTVQSPTIPSLRHMAFQYIWPLVPSMAFIIFGLLLVGLSITLAQTRFLWASSKVGLDLSKIKFNPLEFFTRMASPYGLMEIAKSFVKLLIVGWVAYTYLNDHTKEFLSLLSMGVPLAFLQWAGMAYDVGMRVAYAYLILGIVDYLFQRWNYERNLKMSKEEIKDEHIQSEGNPIIKGAQKSKMRQMAFQRMMSAVPRASVVITNPTFLAIAVEYEPGMRAPKVVAKGMRLVAERIMDVAKQHNIPIVENVPLARALYSTVDIDQEIPPELYTAMAEVLVFIFRMRGMLTTAAKPSQP